MCLRSGIEFDKKDLIKLVQTYGLQSSSLIMEKSLDRASLGDLEVAWVKGGIIGGVFEFRGGMISRVKAIHDQDAIF